MPSNDDRARRVAPSVTRYRTLHAWGEPSETVFVDMLADLMHYANSLGEDPYNLLRLAQLHYHAEITGDEFCIDDESEGT